MTTVALGVRLMAVTRAGAVLVARPHGCVHLHTGPLTRTRRAVPHDGRPVCGVRARRLRTVERVDGALDLRGRRFCRRCTSAPPVAEVQRLRTRDDWIGAYGHLTVDDLRIAARWCRTVEETHQVGVLASMIAGPAGIRPSDDYPDLDALILLRRRRLTAAGRTPEEIDANRLAREQQAWDNERVASARRSAAALNRAVDRKAQGGFLMPWERDVIANA